MLAGAAAFGGAVPWKPAQGPLMTRWAKDVSPLNVLPEYPRPQMVRKDWLNLNGLWDYTIRPETEATPSAYEGKIMVPFPVESALSGVMRKPGATNHLWYHRTFRVPKGWSDKQVILRFGAVDWDATAWVNGKEVGKHRGGYDEFSFNITSALKASGDQEVIVAVSDPTDSADQPRGKQVNRPNGIWYTSVSGIWQTVWLEPLAKAHVENFRVTPDVDGKKVDFEVVTHAGTNELFVQAQVMDGRSLVNAVNLKVEDNPSGGMVTNKFSLLVPNAKLWSPDSPFLYDLKIQILRQGEEMDTVGSYVGMRKIALGKDDKGITRILLNNKPIFQFGPLDQGWWPDGLYTAPTDEALKYDIETTKKLGFNMARKHVKVEPERWYYWCDKLGLLVWQDMPSAFTTGRRSSNNADYPHSPDSSRQFEAELKSLIDGRRNHPSIVMWVPFNEGWGQYDTERITKWVKDYDPTRLVNNASGWTDRHAGDVHDIHAYPGPSAPAVEDKRAGVLGEFGGLGLPLPGHTWQSQANWGYRSYSNRTELTDAYLSLVKKLHPMAGLQGLCAAVYTQTSDVEVEVNGLMTYDRALIKMDQGKISAANRMIYTPPPPALAMKVLVPSSREQGVDWRYTTIGPSGNWFAVDFKDGAWAVGPGGFGTRTTPGAVVRTEWNTSDIWLRRTFELPADFKVSDPCFLLHHDEDAEIYINGQLALRVTGPIGTYETVDMNRQAQKLLKPGQNTLAVHCHQTVGGQYIDVGIVTLEPTGK